MSLPVGSGFLNYFWDLASADDAKRLAASVSIIEHLRSCSAASDDSSVLSKDGEYSLKRLVRGLASSRESARHGFATCLTEMIRSIDGVGISEVLELIRESTRVTGSIKGQDERDLLFGKLFGYMSIVRSGKIRCNDEYCLEVLQGLLDLHKRKVWIREVVVEAILDLAPEFNVDILSTKGIPLMEHLFPEALEAMSPTQLMFAAGIEMQARAIGDSHLMDIIATRLPKKRIISNKTLKKIESTLIAACGGFPKIHRVWDYVLTGIFTMSDTRVLLPQRVDALSEKSEQFLATFSAFIADSLMGAAGSHEKRSVALRLTVEIAKRVPAEMIPAALSQSVVRTILTARRQPKNVLYAYAGNIVQELVETIGTDTGARLALASALQQYGGANFDGLTGGSAVKTLLQGVDGTAIVSHIKFLCGMIGAASTTREQPGDDDEDGEKSTNTSFLSTVETLIATGKNTQLQSRGTTCAIVIAVLVRLAYFEGKVDISKMISASVGGKASKKKGKKGVDAEASTAIKGLNEDIVEALGLIEVGAPFPPAFSNIAAAFLGPFLKDVGLMSAKALNEKSDTKPDLSSSAVSDGEPLLLAFATDLLGGMLNSGATLARVDMDGDELKEAVLGGCAAARTAFDSSSSSNRLLKPIQALLGHGLFLALSSQDIQISAIEDISIAAQKMLSLETKDSKKDSKANRHNDDEDEDEDDSPQMRLFDGCMELLSVSSENSVKAIRDNIRRTWEVVCQTQQPEPDLIDMVMAAVLGEDGAEVEDEEEENDEDEEDKDGEEDEEEDGDSEGEETEEEEGEEEEEVEDKKRKQAPQQKETPGGGKGKNKKKKKNSNDSDDDLDDLMVEDEDAVMNLLMGEGFMNGEGLDNSDDDNSDANSFDGGDDEGADAALASMVLSQREGRKKGLMDSKKRALLLRTRALDIMDIMLSRWDIGEQGMFLLVPLVDTLFKTQTSATIQRIAEGRAYEQRLSSLVVFRLCKKPFRLTEASSESVCEEFSVALKLIAKGLRGSVQASREVAVKCAVLLIKTALSGSNTSAQEQIGAMLSNLLQEFTDRKACKVPVQLFDELVLRYPPFAATRLLPGLTRGMIEGKSSFLRTECCRLASAVFRQYKLFPSETLKVLVSLASTAATNIGTSLKQPKDAQDLRSNRAKSMAQLSKDLAVFIRVQVNAEGLNKSSKDANNAAMKALEDSIAADNLENLPPGAARLFEQALDMLTSQPRANDKKQQKKRKEVEAEAEAEIEAVSDVAKKGKSKDKDKKKQKSSSAKKSKKE